MLFLILGILLIIGGVVLVVTGRVVVGIVVAVLGVLLWLVVPQAAHADTSWGRVAHPAVRTIWCC